MVVDNADGLVANQIGVVAVFLEKRAVSLSIDDAAPFLGEVVHFADEVTVEMIPNFSRRLEIAAPFCRLLRETFLVEIAVESHQGFLQHSIWPPTVKVGGSCLGGELVNAPRNLRT
jgi:hypothetical protein